MFLGGKEKRSGMRWVKRHFVKLLGKCTWDKIFKNGPSNICGRQPLKNFTWSILEYFVSNDGDLL